MPRELCGLVPESETNILNPVARQGDCEIASVELTLLRTSEIFDDTTEPERKQFLTFEVERPRRAITIF